MLKFKTSLAAMFCAVVCTGCATDLERRFQSHIDYLASDALTGRGVGTEGIELAADYIGRQFAQIGLEPAGDNGTYFQTFPMTLQRRLTQDGYLRFSGDKTSQKMGVDYIPFAFSSDAEFKGGLTFVGYGIENPDRGYNDFDNIDLEGSVAMFFDGEPASWADQDGNATRHAMLRNKIYNCKDRGAVAVLVMNSTPLPESGDRLTEFLSRGSDDYGIPAMQVTRELAEAVLRSARVKTLDELQEKMDRGENASSPVAHVMVSGKADFEKQSAPTRNVLGILRGSGPLADEYVVVGAHYDHLGIRKPMMRKFSKGKVLTDAVKPQIHNGADDNASGTSGLIESARMLAAGPTMKRSVLFIAFTAEESGLHGSKHFIQSNRIPLKSIVAMVNMDMIGRLKPGTHTVQVFGADTGVGLHELVRPHAANVGLKVAFAGGMGGRSDNASFDRKKIPAIHFYSGAHNDYHKPSDDANLINARGGAKITRLVVDVTRDLANRQTRIAFVQPKKVKKDPSAAGTPVYRVVMGLTPSYGDDGGEGMAVDAVSPEGPADLGGMKAGDRIVGIGGKPVRNIYDYMAATRKNKAGDAVDVAVLRHGKRLTLKVTLAAAR